MVGRGRRGSSSPAAEGDSRGNPTFLVSFFLQLICNLNGKKKEEGEEKRERKKHLQPGERGLSPLGAVGWAAASPGPWPSLPGCPVSPFSFLRGGMGRGQRACRAPPPPLPAQALFPVFITVIGVGCLYPGQLGTQTGSGALHRGGYLWPVAGADNAPSRALPAPGIKQFHRID